jgi:hypothetical protein
VGTPSFNPVSLISLHTRPLYTTLVASFPFPSTSPPPPVHPSRPKSDDLCQLVHDALGSAEKVVLNRDDIPLLTLNEAREAREQLDALTGLTTDMKGDTMNMKTLYDARQLVTCSSVLAPGLSVPEKGVVTRLKKPWCCGVKGTTPCELCASVGGVEGRLGPKCVSEMEDTEEYAYQTYKAMPRGGKKMNDKGEEYQPEQRVRVTEHGTMKEIWEMLEEEFEGEYLPHYCQDRWIANAQKVVEMTFGENTIVVNADFAAVIAHTFSGGLTCGTLAHSNCEVIIVSHSPRDEIQEDGSTKRVMTTECWYVMRGRWCLCGFVCVVFPATYNCMN